MANLTTTGTTGYPSVLDTRTTLVDGSSGDEIVANHPNGLGAAVIAIETELGTLPKGSAADLKTRLAVALYNDGTLRQLSTTTLPDTTHAIGGAIVGGVTLSLYNTAEGLRLATTGDVTGAGTIYMRFNDTNGNAAYVGYGGAAASQFDLYNIKNGPVVVSTNNIQRLVVSAAGSIVPGTATLATPATDGFIYMTSSAGAPTGVPTTFTGRLAFHYDATNNQIYVYNGAWKKTVALT